MKRDPVHRRLKGVSRRDFLAWSAASALGAAGAGCGTGGVFVPPSPRGTSLHISAPNGMFAWFQLLWPHVEVALADNPAPSSGALAYHEPAAAGFHFTADATTDDREWFASSAAPWIDPMGNPYPGMEVTAFMAGRDETHTQFPTTAAVVSGKADLLAGAAAIQVQESSALLPVIGVDPVLYGTAPGAPNAAAVPNADGLVDLFENATGQLGVVTPTPQDLTLFGIDGVLQAPDSELSPTQRQGLDEFGRMMIVTAKAMAMDLTDVGLLGMTSGPTADTSWVDPHSAFENPGELQRATNCAQRIGGILEGFYQYLGAVPDPRVPGLSLIDNTVITIHGDTPHTPLQAAGWPDQTPDGANWIYVVGKGYLKHGWFGRVHVAPPTAPQTSGFDGATGADVPGKSSDLTSTVAGGAIAYAIAKGDSNFVSSTLGAPLADYAGLLRS